MENDNPPEPDSPENNENSLILACSPRAGGNCDAAAEIFADARKLPGGKPLCLHLRDWHILPCIACGACDGQKNSDLIKEAARSSPRKPLWRCPQSLKDQSRPVFTALSKAESLCLIAPIFFYHLPAQLKAFLDRLQPFWNPPGHAEPQLVPRPCKVILIAGRTKGEALFSGSLHTLRLSLGGQGFHLEDPLLLRGFDGIGSLAANGEAVAQITGYGKKA